MVVKPNVSSSPWADVLGMESGAEGVGTRTNALSSALEGISGLAPQGCRSNFCVFGNALHAILTLPAVRALTPHPRPKGTFWLYPTLKSLHADNPPAQHPSNLGPLRTVSGRCQKPNTQGSFGVAVEGGAALSVSPRPTPTTPSASAPGKIDKVGGGRDRSDGASDGQSTPAPRQRQGREREFVRRGSLLGLEQASSKGHEEQGLEDLGAWKVRYGEGMVRPTLPCMTPGHKLLDTRVRSTV